MNKEVLLFSFLFFLVLILFKGCSAVEAKDGIYLMPGSKIYDVTDPASWGGDPSIAASPDDASDDDALGINAAMQAAVDFLKEKQSQQTGPGAKDYNLQQLVWIPEGTYHLSSQVIVPKFGNNQKNIWLAGEGENSTVIKLKESADIGNFGSENKPIPVIQFAEYTHGTEGSGNTNFHLFATDFSIEVPSDQPHAIGLSYGCANFGAARNLTIKAGSQGGHTGLALVQYNNGPAWVENVTVEGFDTGLEISDGFGEIFAFSSISLLKQNKGGTALSVADKQISMENLHIEQNQADVTPIHLLDDDGYNSEHGGAPHLILINGSINSSVPAKSPAIRIDKGHSYLRNIKINGYGTEMLIDHGKTRNFDTENTIKEFVSVHGKTEAEKENVIVTRGTTDKSSLNLPVKTTPDIPRHVFERLSVGDYTVFDVKTDYTNDNRVKTSWVIVDPSGLDDHTRQLQSAINSGAKYIGLLNTKPFSVSNTITINGQGDAGVELIFGYISEIHATQELTLQNDANSASEKVLFRIEDGKADSLFIKGLRITDHARTTSDLLLFYNNSSQILVFEDIRSKDAPKAYRNTAAGHGKDIFFENVEFAYNGIFNDVHVLVEKQNVWARQYNLEAPINDGLISYNGQKHSKYTTIPKLVNSGGSVWVFSQKLGEHNGNFVHTEEGGKTELLGAYFNLARTNDFVTTDDATNFTIEGSGSEFSMVGQERIRTYFNDQGNATKELPHGNKFGIYYGKNGTEVLNATSLPTYLTYEGIDPFQDTVYSIYDAKNHFRVAGLLKIRVNE